MTLNTVLQECLQEIFLDILFIISNDPYTQLSMIFANFFKARFCYLISYLESHVANIASVFEKTTGVNFKKALMLAFNYYRKNAEKYILALKTPVFLATNTEQHVGNFSIFVAHFGIFKTKFWS